METIMLRSCTVLLLLTVLVSLPGCGGAFKTGESWDPKESRMFDDGVDLLQDISRLSGEWEYQAEQELEARTHLADMVAVVNVLAVQTNEDLEGIESKKIEARIEDIIYGDTPSNDLSLKSSANSLGYSLILRHEQHLVGKQIVFMRWFTQDDKSLGHHFHLSPSSGKLEKKVRKLIEARVKEEDFQNVK
jgi:hypothetical protein